MLHWVVVQHHLSYNFPSYSIWDSVWTTSPYTPLLPSRSIKIGVGGSKFSKKRDVLKVINFYLKRFQERVKQMVDQKRSDKQYKEGDWGLCEVALLWENIYSLSSFPSYKSY